MMKMRMKLLAMILMVLLLCVSAVGCGGAGNSNPTVPEGEGSSSSEPTEPSGEPLKVALIMSGPISDMSWNATAYNGLKEIEKLGAHISYQENVDNSSLVDAMHTYATGGFDLIFLSTNSYEELALGVTPDYPDVTFMMINGSVTKDNVYSIQVADEHQGFLMFICALSSKNKQVGFVGGLEITPIINGQLGFIEGVKYVDESIDVRTVMTGSMVDVNGAKEYAKALIDAGVDVIAPMADQASLGVLEAAQEGGVKAVAQGFKQEEVAPEAVLIAVIKDTSIAYKAAYEAYVSGTLSNTTNKMGAAEGVVFLTDWMAAADDLDEGVKAEVQKIYEGLIDGSIKVTVG